MTKEELKAFKENKVTSADLDLIKSSETPNIVYFSREPSINAKIIAGIL
jgi:hypothetical protein